MKKWTLSDLAEFGHLSDGSEIKLHGTTYVLHNVNRWNDSCLLEDIGLKSKTPFRDAVKAMSTAGGYNV